MPIRQLSAHSTSRLARQADTGLAHHRVIDVDESVAVLDAKQPAAEQQPAAEAPVWDWAAANQRKVDAVQQFAPLIDALDELDNSIAELLARTSSLELG